MSRGNTTFMVGGWWLPTIFVLNIFVVQTTAHLLPETATSIRSRDIRNPQVFRGTKNLLQRSHSIADSKKESRELFETARRDETGDENHYPDVTERDVKSDIETALGSELTDATQALYGNGDQRPPIPVTQDQYDEFVYWAQMCAATYCPENIVHGRNNTVLNCGLAGNCKKIEKDGWTTMYEFKDEGKQGATGIVTVPGDKADPSKKDIIVLGIRGTQTNRNWAADFDFRDHKEVSWCKGCKTHAGFHGAWDTVRDPVLKIIDDYIKDKQQKHDTWNGKVVVTGHSMGGGVSTVAATDIRIHFENKGWKIRVDLISFAAPRSLNGDLAQYVEAQAAPPTSSNAVSVRHHNTEPPSDPPSDPVSKQVNWRITHEKDIVPKVPLMINGFRHPGTQVLIKALTLVTPLLSDLTIYPGIESQGAADREQADLKSDKFNQSMVVDVHEWYFFGITRCGMCEKDGGANSTGCVNGVARRSDQYGMGRLGFDGV